MPNAEIEIDGNIYAGRYEIQGEMIEVSYGLKTKKAQLGGSVGAPDVLARAILAELVHEEQQQPGGG